MRRSDRLRTTSDPRTFHLTRRRILADAGHIRCDRCRPHSHCNVHHHPDRSWKAHRPTQFRGV